VCIEHDAGRALLSSQFVNATGQLSGCSLETSVAGSTITKRDIFLDHARAAVAGRQRQLGTTSANSSIQAAIRFQATCGMEQRDSLLVIFLRSIDCGLGKD